MRGDIDGETRPHRVDDREGLHLRLGLRHDPHREDLARECAAGVPDGQGDGRDLRRIIRPRVVVLVDDLPFGGRGDLPAARFVGRRQQDDGVPFGVDPVAEDRQRHGSPG